jgi:hypothetical protein
MMVASHLANKYSPMCTYGDRLPMHQQVSMLDLWSASATGYSPRATICASIDQASRRRPAAGPQLLPVWLAPCLASSSVLFLHLESGYGMHGQTGIKYVYIVAAHALSLKSGGLALGSYYTEATVQKPPCMPTSACVLARLPCRSIGCRSTKVCDGWAWTIICCCGSKLHCSLLVNIIQEVPSPPCVHACPCVRAASRIDARA